MAGENVYTHETFWWAFTKDLATARCKVLLHSGFISQYRIRELEPILEELLNIDVTVCAFVQNPRAMNKSGLTADESRELKYFNSCVEMLRKIGVHVTIRTKRHEKIGIIDDRILWEGSLNPLSHFDTAERMRRFADTEEAKAAIELHGLKCTVCLENYAQYAGGTSVIRLGALFKKRRKNLRMSQRELANRSSVNHMQIGRFEKGAESVSLSVLFRLAEELDVEIIPVPKELIPSVTRLLRQNELNWS